jgi:hypothetical protein
VSLLQPSQSFAPPQSTGRRHALAVPSSLQQSGSAPQKSHLKKQWHAIAFAIITKEDGSKALLIYDTEAKDFGDREPQRVRDVLKHGALKELASWTRQINSSLEVWVNKSRSTERGKERCVAISCKKLAKWISYGDMIFIGKGDPRVRVMGDYYCVSKP